MQKIHRTRPIALGIAIAVLVQLRAMAIVWHVSGDPDINANTPMVSGGEIPWRLQGKWGIFTGTPISENLFLTAAHVGGEVGDTYTLDGMDYTTAASFSHPNADLRVFKIYGAFPEFATLYSGRGEVQETALFLGRGTQRGNAVMVGDELRGWSWGERDHQLRWGLNVIEDFAGASSSIMVARFDSKGLGAECHLSTGDSGGGVFIRQNGGWALAGINSGVSGPYRYEEEGSSFNAALFSEAGLYKQSGADDWILQPDNDESDTGALLSVRLSPFRIWLDLLIAQNAFRIDQVILESASTPSGPYAIEQIMETQDSAIDFRVIPTDNAKFYRLRSSSDFRIDGILLDDSGALIIDARDQR